MTDKPIIDLPLSFDMSDLLLEELNKRLTHVTALTITKG